MRIPVVVRTLGPRHWRERGGFPSTSTGETWLGEGELPVESVGVLLLTSASASSRTSEAIYQCYLLHYPIPKRVCRPVTQLGDKYSRLAELDLCIQPALRRMNLRPDGRPLITHLVICSRSISSASSSSGTSAMFGWACQRCDLCYEMLLRSSGD